MALLELLPSSASRQDEAATRAAQCLVRGGGYNMGMADRILVLPGSHKAGNVGHIRQQKGADFIGNLPETREIYGRGIGAGPANKSFWVCIPLPLPTHHHIITAACFPAYSITLHIIYSFARKIHLAAVRKMAAVAQVHAQDRRRVPERQSRRHIGSRNRNGAAHWHTGRQKVRALSSSARLFCLVHISQPPYERLPIAFRILVRQHAALRLLTRGEKRNFRSDHFQLCSPGDLDSNNGCGKFRA